MKRVLNTLVLIVAIVFSLGWLGHIKAMSAYNYYRNQHEDGLHLEYKGYVQVLPSYNEGGRHAQAGYVRYYIPSNWCSPGKDSGRQYTPEGMNEGDNRILSKNYTFYDSLCPVATKTQFEADFIWQPHTGDPNRPWPKLFRVIETQPE
jgi:hypothetical protein